MRPEILARRFHQLRTIGLLAIIGALFGCVDLPKEEEATVIAHHAPAVSTNKTSYLPNESVTVSWSDLPGNPMDWVAITDAGAPPNAGFHGYAFTGGAVSGSVTFPGLAIGNYEARAYVNDTYVIIASSNFDVAASTAVTVATDQPSYTASQPVNVSWTNMPGNQLDWVAITVAGSAPNAGFLQWRYINGQVNGATAFTGLPAGNFEARMYLNDTFQVLATTNFTVTNTSVSTNKSVYGPTEPVVVSFTGMPGNALDYVAINTAGSPPNSGFQQFQYTMGEVNGQRTFTGLFPGTYEARAYLDDSFTVIATTYFTVNSSMTSVTTDKTAYTVGETVNVSWSGLPGSQTDWVGIFPLGAPDQSNPVDWRYTNGQTSGSYGFTGVPMGTYEARTYLNDTWVVAARSPSFTVGVANTCVSAPQRPVFAGLTTGELVIAATAQETEVALSVPLDRSILFMSVRENEPSPRHGGVQCLLHDAIPMGAPAGLTCSRNTPGTDFAGSTGEIRVRYTVATFTSGVTVQRGLASTSAANPASVTLSSVDPASTFVLLGGLYNGGSGWGNNEFARGQLVNSTTLQISTNAVGTDVPWQVVSMIGASVQRGTASFASGDTSQSVTINSAPSGSVAFASYTTDNASGIAAAALMMQTVLVDATTLAFSREAGGAALDVSWEVVSLPFATISGMSVFNAGQTSSSEPISGHSAAACVGVASSQAINGQSSGSTTYAGADLDIVGEAQATFSVSASSVDVQRAASQASAEIPWTVIDFSRDCTGL